MDSYDIFRDLPEGPIWVESVEGFNHIAKRLQALNEKSPGQYFAYDVSKSCVVAILHSELSSALIADEAKTKAASSGQ